MSKLYKITLASDFVSWGICDGTGWEWQVSECEYTDDAKNWQTVKQTVAARCRTATDALEQAQAFIKVWEVE